MSRPKRKPGAPENETENARLRRLLRASKSREALAGFARRDRESDYNDLMFEGMALRAALELERTENLKLKQGATQYDLEMFVTQQAYRLVSVLTPPHAP